MISNEADFRALVHNIHQLGDVPMADARRFAAVMVGSDSFESYLERIKTGSVVIPPDAMERARVAVLQMLTVGDGPNLYQSVDSFVLHLFSNKIFRAELDLQAFDALPMPKMIRYVSENSRTDHWSFGQTELLQMIEGAENFQCGHLTVDGMKSTIKTATVIECSDPDAGATLFSVEGIEVVVRDGPHEVAQLCGRLYVPIEEPTWEEILTEMGQAWPKDLMALKALRDHMGGGPLEVSYLHIDLVYVAPTHRGKQIGTRLITEVLRHYCEEHYAGYVYIRGFCDEFELPLPEGSQFFDRRNEIRDYMARHGGRSVRKELEALQMELILIDPELRLAEEDDEADVDGDDEGPDYFRELAESSFDNEADRKRAIKLAKAAFKPGASIDQMIPWSEVSCFEDGIEFFVRLGISRHTLTPASCGRTLGLMATIQKLRPNLFAKDSHIVIAGAGVPDVTAVCLMQVANSLHPDFAPQQFSLVGPALSGDPVDRNTEESLHLYPMYLAHLPLYTKRDVIDGIVLMHPGIEFSRDLWLRDQGLFGYVKDKVPVMVTAYRLDEAKNDRDLLQAYGYKLGPLCHNPICAPVSASSWTEGEFICQFVYEITGVDEAKWKNPDVPAAIAVLDRVKQEPITSEIEAIINRRRKVLQSGSLKEREQETASFNLLVNSQAHPAPYLRELLSAPNNRSMLKTYQLASYVNGIIPISDVMSDAALIAFFEKHPDVVDAVDGLGVSPLHVAAACGRTEVVRWLLENGSDPLLQSDFGPSAFMFALSVRHEKTVELMLASAKGELLLEQLRIADRALGEDKTMSRFFKKVQTILEAGQRGSKRPARLN